MANILLGVTGGIAVYKSVDIVSRLVKLGHNVNVCMTRAATEFVTPLTFQSISKNNVVCDMFRRTENVDIEHISLAQKADLILIAPATANIIGKLACGIADDFLTTTVMASEAKVFIAPAMNTKMYNNIAYKDNEKILKNRGFEFIDPVSGRLACGDIGSGKLQSPEVIVDIINMHLNKKRILENKNILITAGPTREPIDPVNYISNYSSGKMGYALAQKAVELGANVKLISGPTNLEIPNNVEFISVVTTSDMEKEVRNHFGNSDLLIMAAAPIDLKTANYSEHKIKKTDKMIFEFVKHNDILLGLKNIKEKQIVVGFAAETRQIEEYAIDKLNRKGLDYIIANDVSNSEIGFNSDDNEVKIFDKNGNCEKISKQSKINLAEKIFLKIIDEMKL